MAKQISKFRLAVNGIGTAFIAILCLSVGLPGAVKLLLGTVHFGADPDSADKALALQVLSTGIGLIALFSLFSLFRTILAWRKSP